MKATHHSRRIVITGAGAVCACGGSAADLWRAMRAGQSAIEPLALVGDSSVREKPLVAASARDFDPSLHFASKKLLLLDRVSQFALVAAREAVAQAGLDFAQEALGETAAIVVGTGIGGETTHDEQSKKMYGEHSARIHPLTIVRVMANAPASQIAIEFGIRGPTFAVSTACASSNHAFAQAVLMIRSGITEVAIAGGTEACLTYGTFKAWEAMRVLADDTCRPFSLQRRGLVLGEGAGMFVLETLEHAKRRGAVILAELAGIGMSADAADIVAPSAAGASLAMRRALSDAALTAESVDYINAHGTATAANDSTECAAIRSVLGDHANAVMVSSTKAVHGHALGAAGALELVAVLGTFAENIVPPTANFLDADPNCDLDVVPNVARERKVRVALSNSFAFGGLNAVLALRVAS